VGVGEEKTATKVIYLGTGEIGVPTLVTLLNSRKYRVIAVITQPDRPAGRSLMLRTPTPKILALERGIPVLQPEKLQADLQIISALEPDLIVTMAYGQILPRGILQLPKVACLNVHPSLLPRHRGASPIHATLLCGDMETGITITYMSSQLDSGDILLKESLAVLHRETNGHLQERLSKMAPHTLMRALHLLESGAAPRLPQNPVLVTYSPRLTKQDARLRWTEDAKLSDRRVRAMHPWPGAFCLWKENRMGSKRLRVLEAEPKEDKGGVPGKVLSVGREGIVVQCFEGSLLVRKVLPEGRCSMPATEFARRHRIQVGDVLG
jgi:methionyl-tRNA formyltransferase